MLTNVSLFAVAQDFVQPACLEVERTMQVLWLGSNKREAFVEALQELGQKSVAGLSIAYVLKTKLLHQPILQSAIGSLDALLGLTGVRAQDLDV